MSVSFYRNMLNQEMKSFSRFSKKIVGNLSNEDIKADVIFNASKDYCLSELQNYDTVIIISHGSAYAIYHKFDHEHERHQILLNRANLEILRDKKVIAISCGTARNLGKDACEIGGCKAFLGFYNKIHFDKVNKKKVSKKYHVFIVACYKDAFSKVLEASIKNNWTFSKLKQVLKIELRKIVMTRVLEIKKSRPHYYKNHGLDQAVIAVTNVANNIHVFGNENEQVG